MTKEEFLKIDNFRDALRALKADEVKHDDPDVVSHVNALAKIDPALQFYDKDGIHRDPNPRDVNKR